MEGRFILDSPSSMHQPKPFSNNPLALIMPLQRQRLVSNVACPRYAQEVESMDHIFQRNVRVHELKVNTGHDIAHFINSYSIELEVMEKRKLTQKFVVANWRRPSIPIIKINFDGAFSNSMFRSSMGLVARNMEGQVLFSCSMLYENTPSSFTIEVIVCLRAVQVGLERGWLEVTVEGDASTNRQVNLLATESLKRNEEYYLEGGVPVFTERLMVGKKLYEPK
ncbi:hypothetical protein GOBAR_DD28540 [Gossypium barbadense]|nr:hypothetical protein GOBAR_DD28540 [Gossypium barbadense]